MKDIEVKEENGDIICGNCTGDFIQVEHKENIVKLFSLKGYMKWFYQCNKCGKQSKLFTSKINKK